MIPLDTQLLYTALATYIFAALAFFLYFLRPRGYLMRLALGTVFVAFFSHTLLLLLRYLSLDFFPVIDLHHSLLFFAWILIAGFLVITLYYDIPTLGSFITPLATIFLACSASAVTDNSGPIPVALRSLWLPIHSTLAFLGEAGFALAFAVAVMYLIQENQIKRKKWTVFFYQLPSLQTLDDLNYLCLSVGFLFITLGIITGSIWAQQAWGSYWSWDPKETWSLITWLIYAALLHARLASGWRGKRAAIFSIIGFGAVLFTFLGVNLFIPGLHNYDTLISQRP